MNAPYRADSVGVNRDEVAFFALEERKKADARTSKLAMHPG
jgi:hypothetical protein